MKEAVSRKSIIKKAALAVSALALPSYLATGCKQKVVKRVARLSFQWETADPFLFCVHHKDLYPAGNAGMGPAKKLLSGRQIGQDFVVKDGWRMYHGAKVPGFPGHPHRGFETVTIVTKGIVDHHDSMGATGRYSSGDVQWLTAGAGIQHAEMFPLIHRDQDNTLELFQIWLNLPKARKFAKPSYKMLWSETIPRVSAPGAEVTVIAGQYGGKKAPAPPPASWANQPQNDVAIFTISLAANATFILPAAATGLNRTLYFYEGDSLKASDADIRPYHAVELVSDEEVTLVNGSQPGKLLLLQGRPIGEPVVQHGPFVMNTRAEIRQAYADYQSTRFGGWPWKSNDPINSRDKGRFARHADGTEELRG